MPKIKLLEKELATLEKKAENKQIESELKRRIKELKYHNIIKAKERAITIAEKIGMGVRKVAKISGVALDKLKEKERKAEELERKKQKANGRRPPKEETYAERLNKALGF